MKATGMLSDFEYKRTVDFFKNVKRDCKYLDYRMLEASEMIPKCLDNAAISFEGKDPASDMRIMCRRIQLAHLLERTAFSMVGEERDAMAARFKTQIHRK